MPIKRKITAQKKHGEQQTKKPKPKQTFFFSSALELKHGEGKVSRCKMLFLVPGITEELTDTPLDELDIIGFDKPEDMFQEDSKAPKREIIEAVNSLKPENLVLLFDANTLHNPFSTDKDMAIKPKWLCKIVKRFHFSIAHLFSKEEMEKRRAFFVHLEPDLLDEKAVHLKDLFQDVSKNKAKRIRESLTSTIDSEYFRWLRVTEDEAEYAYFFGANDVERFWKLYGERCEIGTQEFVFNKWVYQRVRGWIHPKEHVDSSMFLNVKSKYVIRTVKEIADGTRVIGYDTFDKTGIIQLYGGEFLRHIKYYQGFVNEPDFSGHYKREHQYKVNRHQYNYYNVAEPFDWKPEPGEFPHCLKLFHNIFRGNATVENPIIGDRFTIWMDWLKVAVKYPKQKLPMIIMASEENMTGKSTLLDFLVYVFGPNAIKTDMEDLLGRFNPHNAYKKFKLLEEIKMDGDKEVAKNKLKELITGPVAFVEAKGLNKEQISNHAAIIAATNHEDNVMKLEESDTRFFVVKPGSIPKGSRDPHIFQKMKKEVPALLHYLLTSEITHPQKSRTWFDEELIKTEEFWKVVEHSKTFVEKDIESYMRELFLTYRITDQRMYLDYLVEYFRKRPGYSYQKSQIKKVFEKRGYKKTSKTPSTVKIPVGIVSENGEKEIRFYKEDGGYPCKRYYVCHAKDWLTEEELEDMKISFEEMYVEPDYDVFKVQLNGTTESSIFGFLDSFPELDRPKLINELLDKFNQAHDTDLKKEKFIESVRAYKNSEAKKRYVELEEEGGTELITLKTTPF